MFQIAVYASLSWRRALLVPVLGTGLALGLAACQPDAPMGAVSAEQGRESVRQPHAPAPILVRQSSHRYTARRP